MRGYINKDNILDLYDRLSYLEKFEAVAAVISETLPTEEPLDDADYYFVIYTIWNIIETNRK
jgi:hypothetical protein